MKCAIFGAAGFIGRHLAASLRDAGHEWIGFDVAGEPFIHGREIIQCDAARAPIDLPNGIDSVYYLAQSRFSKGFPEHGDDLFAVNVIGTLRAVQAALNAGARYFCFASTGTVYAPSFSPLHENCPLRRDDAYALSKVQAEEILALIADRMTITSARFFGVFGPGQRQMLVPQIIERVRSGRPVTLQRHPRNQADQHGLQMSLSYVEDVAGILLRLGEAALQGKAVGGALNVAGPQPISLRTLAETIGTKIGVVPKFETTSARLMDYIADISRLKSMTHSTFTPLEQAIERTVNAHAT